MTLIFPAEDPTYRPPAWMGLPEDIDVSGRQRPSTEYYSIEEDAQLGQVLSQDAALLPVVQKGMRSRG
ncbi:MAG: aromatic ring-hydroxylating oxygenase subunit alpha, partial [Halioglobus sp.]